MLYVNNSTLYFDEAFEHAANTDEVQYLFLVGLTVVNAGAYYKPVHLAVADGIATVTLIGADGNKVAVKSVAVETE